MQSARPALAAHPTRQDWYVIPSEWLPEIAAAPTVILDGRWGPVAHRSHLPLLAKSHPEIETLLNNRLPFDRDQFDAQTSTNGWKLRDYQHEGREFIRDRRGTLLAFQMRTGKTATCVASHELADGPLVVVAPLATREVWLGWFRRRWPDVRPLVLAGKHVAYVDPKTKRERKRQRDLGYDLLEGEYFRAEVLVNAQIVFMHYDILAGWKNFGNRRIGTLVFDEIHLLSNRKSRRSVAAMYLAAQANRVIGATGTPIWNKPAGLYTTLASLCPGAWGKFYEYAKRYAGGRLGPHGFVADSASHEEEFRLRMCEVMIRRSWHEIATQLPTISRTTEVVPITEQQAFAVEKEAERVRDHARRSTQIGATARFRRLLANLKIEGAIDAAKRVLDGGERVIIWTWHRDVAVKIEAALARDGYPGFVVSGATPVDLREAIFNQWRAHPCSPLCITLSVGQVGIDLSAARQEVFAELDYTPAVVAQAEMRPFNGLQPIAATYVIIDHDVERKILEALQNKCELAFRLGVPAAESAIDVIASGFTGIGGGALSVEDLDAIAAAVLADYPEDEDEHDYHGTLWNHDWEAMS
ncbi:MAG: SNF2-related protein [Candidatus Sigynarchaeota archaeon]|jgi:SNF2 family DNA or RNA helicase